MADVNFTTEELENEIWKSIEANPAYDVSNLGRVMRTAPVRWGKPSQRILKSALHKDGYRQVSLSFGSNDAKKTFRVHILVAIAFLPPCPEGYDQVNHLDHIRSNNRADNLEWSNNTLNQQWSRQAGRAVRGEQMSKAKLKDTDIPIIRNRLSAGDTLQSIADDYGVHNTVIFHIKHGHAWKHIP